MKRALAALLSATLLSAVVAVSAIAVSGGDGHVCDKKDMNTLKTVSYAVFDDTPSARDCEFRLFLGTALGHPLRWTEDEYFFGGTFWWLELADVEERDLSVGDVMKYLGQIEERLFWGKASTPDAQLTELKLQRGPTFHEDDGLIKRQSYYVFPPQEPGLYKWRYEYDDHTIYADVVRGEVCIAPVPFEPGC